MMRTFGIGKGGVHVGKMVSAVGAMLTPFVTCYESAGFRGNVVSILTGSGTSNPYAAVPLSSRAMDAARCAAYVGLGYGKPTDFAIPPTTLTPSAKGLAGMAVVGGVGITIAGKFANPLLSGSAVKL